MRIPLTQPNWTSYALERARQALEQGWLSGTGPEIKEFESRLAVRIDREYAVAVTNGTVALELALLALGIRAGDEVIVPALTFAAPAAAVVAVGATPVLVDIHPEHWTLDPDRVEVAITDRTKAIIAVDLLGHPCHWNELLKHKAISHIPIIEDAAEAHGARYHWNSGTSAYCGNMGDVATFSFHANKAIPMGEGGAVLTDDEALAEKMRLIAHHGMTPERPYWHEVVGHNFRMTNLTAAIGCGQMREWDYLLKKRREMADLYDHHLRGLFDEGRIQRRPVMFWAEESVWLYTIASPQRDTYLAALRSIGIDARAIWPALPIVPAYMRYARGSGIYPVAEKVSREAFWLPMTDDPQAILEITGVIRNVKP